MPRHTTLKATYRLFVGFTKLFVIPWSSFGGDFDLCSFDNSNDLTSLTKKEGLNAFSREVRSMCLEIYKQHNTSYSLVWFVPARVLLLQKASKGCENFQNKHAWPTTHIMIDSHGKRNTIRARIKWRNHEVDHPHNASKIHSNNLLLVQFCFLVARSNVLFHESHDVKTTRTNCSLSTKSVIPSP